MEDLPQGYLWNDRTKMEYPQQHQGGTYGDAIPIVIRVKKRIQGLIREYTIRLMMNFII